MNKNETILTGVQVDRFYFIFVRLLIYVNQITKTLPSYVLEKLDRFANPTAEHELRKTLWRNPHLLDGFIQDNPFKIGSEDLDVVAGWKQFRYGDFSVCKVIRGRGVFLSHDDPQEFYSVVPLNDPFKIILPEIPMIVRTALIPYEDLIIYDGSMALYSIRFGPGLRAAAAEWYIEAYERGQIKNNLSNHPLIDTELVAQREKANKSVLRYFKSYLRKKGLSDAIINRDIGTVEKFSDFLARQENLSSYLRDSTMDALQDFLESIAGEISRPFITGLKRFFSFMIDSERIDWELGEEILIILRYLSEKE